MQGGSEKTCCLCVKRSSLLPSGASSLSSWSQQELENPQVKEGATRVIMFAGFRWEASRDAHIGLIEDCPNSVGARKYLAASCGAINTRISLLI